MAKFYLGLSFYDSLVLLNGDLTRRKIILPE